MSLSSLFTDPLFSTIITLYILILLYFPSLFLGIILSPILISTSVLLLSLLRLGAIQQKNQRIDPIPEEINGDDVGDDCRRVSLKANDSSVSGSGSCDNNVQGHFRCSDSFVEWDVRAPLEVIYEGEGEGSDEVSEEKRDAYAATVERYASLSKFYPETDSDTSEEEEEFPGSRGWDSSANIGFRWEGEERDGMIEIELDGKATTYTYSDIEEDNLIEIELHPASSPAGK